MEIKLAIFDMDGTAVRYKNSTFQSSWDAIGIAAGMREEWMRLLDFYLPRPDLYNEWFDKNCELLAGKETAPVFEEIFPPPYAPGFIEMTGYLHENGVTTGILSSGVEVVAERVKNDAGMDFAIANKIYMGGGQFTGGGELVVPMSGKGKLVRQVMQEYRCRKKETAYFGDHFNDIPAWEEVGFPIGISLKDRSCYAAVHHHFPDFLRALGYLRRREVITGEWKLEK